MTDEKRLAKTKQCGTDWIILLRKRTMQCCACDKGGPVSACNWVQMEMRFGRNPKSYFSGPRWNCFLCMLCKLSLSASVRMSDHSMRPQCVHCGKDGTERVNMMSK